MIPLSVGRIAEAVDGRIVGVAPDVIVLDVVKDSGAAIAGAMFVAISGERLDGHDFASDAVARGSAVVLSARSLRDAHDVELPCIVVDDPVRALGRLAAWVRRDLLDCVVVAITGSSGKTSTKDLAASVLATAGTTVRAEGSFNTEVGVPLTILAADSSTRFLVLEMGMRGSGHIAYLADLARPDIGAVINVGTAHLGMLGSRRAIADAKGELIDALRKPSIAVLNADDPLVRQMARRTLAHIVTFGVAAEVSVRAVDVRLDERARASFTLIDQRAETSLIAPVSLQFIGEHHVSNALAAASIALSAGLPVAVVGSALSAAQPASRWRMEVCERPDGVTVINDAYNANPDSMRAALNALSVMGAGKRTWAVLGAMLELGDASVGAHEQVGRHAVGLGISRVVCVGPGTLPTYEAATGVGADRVASVYVPDVDSALDLLARELEPGDIVLVKASRSVGLERLALRLSEGFSP